MAWTDKRSHNEAKQLASQPVEGYPRSSFYAQGVCQAGERPQPEKRGPTCAISDLELLEHIRKDWEQSPFHGEGHRKVWGETQVWAGSADFAQESPSPDAGASSAFSPPPPAGEPQAP